jgi:integrase
MDMISCISLGGAFNIRHGLCSKWMNPLCSNMSAINSTKSQTHSPDNQPSPRRAPLCVSLLFRTSDARRVVPLPVLLSHAIPLGYGRPQRVIAAGLRLKQPQRVIVPLSADEVAKSWVSFRTSRDLALVALMLLNGLRSRETLDLRLEDLQLADAHIRVLGKGNKQRLLPLPAETIEVLQNYLRLERPLTNSPALFVSLKGRHRGQPLTVAGLRSVFRHHRLCSQVLRANPHRFRHTFGAVIVRCGISLPALQQLMGHSHIRTTMLYVQLAPQDVWREYARAVQNRIHLSVPQTL